MPERTEFTFEALDWEGLVAKADRLLRDLFPICRSLTGDGVRQTLRRLQQVADFEIHEIPSGTACYDWTVPDEWNIRDAYVATLAGERLIDFRNNNLHVVSYSVPVDAVLSFDELAPHLHTLPDLPRAIPYRTAYYNRNWGFCLTHEQLSQMDRTASYRVVIDSTLEPGSLTYGEARLAGASGREFLISTYCCHPSLANALPEHTINLHLGLSPRYRGAATLFWPFYFLEPPYAGTTFHYIVQEPDAGDIIHQVVPELSPDDGIHDVACKAVVASAREAIPLLEIFQQRGHWERHAQRATGKNFLPPTSSRSICE